MIKSPQLPSEGTSTPVDRTMGEITKYLEGVGVESLNVGFTKIHGEKERYMTFQLGGINYQMPFKVANIRGYLRQRYNNRGEDWITAQAERIAARQVLYHVKVIFASVKLGMGTLPELLMGYILLPDGDTGEVLRLGEMLTKEKLQLAQT